MVPFDSFGMVSYLHSITAVPCIISEIKGDIYSRPRHLSGRWCVHDDTHLPNCCKLFRHPALPRHAVVSLVTSLVLTKLDYCNSLSVGLPAKLLNRLQAVINTAARLICDARKADHITPVLKDLHWLRIQGRIQYKLYVLAFKCHYWYINYRQV